MSVMNEPLTDAEQALICKHAECTEFACWAKDAAECKRTDALHLRVRAMLSDDSLKKLAGRIAPVDILPILHEWRRGR